MRGNGPRYSRPSAQINSVTMRDQVAGDRVTESTLSLLNGFRDSSTAAPPVQGSLQRQMKTHVHM